MEDLTDRSMVCGLALHCSAVSVPVALVMSTAMGSLTWVPRMSLTSHLSAPPSSWSVSTFRFRRICAL